MAVFFAVGVDVVEEDLPQVDEESWRNMGKFLVGFELK